MALLKKGSKGAAVERLQAQLGQNVDGVFSRETETAVKSWQQANGMEVDGIVSPEMLAALGLEADIALKINDRGEMVKRLQTAMGLEATGLFDDDLDAALAKFQDANGLQDDGVARAPTLIALGLLGDGSVGGGAAEAEATPAPAPRSAAAAAPASAAPTGATTTASGGIGSWAYQLADIDAKDIAALDVDLAVIDYSADGEDATAFKAADTARMKKRPSGGQKKLISYMSIGEAEDYRYYWKPEWSDAATRPKWLDDLNPDWEGNYKVRYWDPAWQAVILGNANAYLDKIIAAGFDGVYLDIIDAFEYWQETKPERPSADRDMIAFVTKIAAYARKKRPDFMIIPQNGEALLADPAYRKVISAQAKEDIFYGQDGDGKANKKGEVNDCLENIRLAIADGIPVLAVEYLKDGRKIDDARQKLAEAGCCSYFGPRDLDGIPLGQFRK